MSEDRCHLRAVAERQRPGETFEQQAAERVLVGAAVDDVTADLLGRDVVDRAHELPIRGTRGRRGVREPEVGKIGMITVALLIEQHVARLDVAVHQAALMGGVERLRELAGDVQSPARAPAVRCLAAAPSGRPHRRSASR